MQQKITLLISITVLLVTFVISGNYLNSAAQEETSQNASQEIAFVRNVDDSIVDGQYIYIYNLETNEERQLVPYAITSWWYSWSPDGTYITFASTSFNDYHNIYRAAVDGSEVDRLTEAANYIPDWSVNDQIVFTTRRNSENRDIYIMNADGSEQTSLYTDEHEKWLTIWAPNGQYLAFYTYNSETEIETINLINGDGSGLKELFKVDYFGDSFVFEWSPDSQEILYLENDVVYIFNVEAMKMQSLVSGDYADATWSPDGSQIALAGFDGTYIVNKDGTNLNMISDRASEHISWSPDGNRLVFTADYDVYIVNIDGADLRQITSTPERELFPTWRPIATSQD